MSCYGDPMLFRKSGKPAIQTLKLQEVPPLVIGFSHEVGLTHEQVMGVRSRHDRDKRSYESIFDQIDELSRAGAKTLVHKQYDELGLLMNVCHGLLNAIQVSTPDIENMVSIARQNGAVGAKLTGAGGGGSIVALCPGAVTEVQSALHIAGYKTLQATHSRGKTN